MYHEKSTKQKLISVKRDVGMALVAILIGNEDFLFLLHWMATRAIPTSLTIAY